MTENKMSWRSVRRGLRSCFILSKAQLRNQFRLNAVFGKNASGSGGRTLVMTLAFALLGGMIAFYAYFLAWGMLELGLGQAVPGYALAGASIMTLIFTILKSNGFLFAFRDYDLVMSLPVSSGAVIASRFFQMYLMNLGGCLLVMLPMGAAFAVHGRPGLFFYPVWLAGMVFAPLIPTSLAAIIGGLITAVATRFRYTKPVALILSFAALFAYLYFVMRLSFGSQDMISGLGAEGMASLGAALSAAIRRMYPPAALFTQAVTAGRLGQLLWFAGVSLLCFFLFAALLALKYKELNAALTTHRRRADFKLGRLKTASPLAALYRKELKRFFSANVYVLNVGMGVVMSLGACAALFFLMAGGPGITGREPQPVLLLKGMLALPETARLLNTLLPFGLAGLLGSSCSTCSALSLEGKNLWILKSLPLRPKTVFDSKILVNLTLTLPASLICSTLLALRFAGGWADAALLYLVPLAYGLLVPVWGMFVNMKLPNYQWETEAAVVKQSLSAMLGSLGGMLAGWAPILLILLLGLDGRVVGFGFVAAALALAAALYRLVSRASL